jgi:hypothetical protein
MRIIAPLAYHIRYIPRRGSNIRLAPFVELIEWDVPEISMSDTADGISLRTPLVRLNGIPSWIAQEWRLLNGELLREAGRINGSISNIQAQHLPHVENDRLKSNFIFQFLNLLKLHQANELDHLHSFNDLYNLAQELMTSGLPVDQIRSRLPPAREVVSDNREKALEITERILSRLVLVDGILWKKTKEPLMRVTISNLELNCTIDFNEEDENRQSVRSKGHEFLLPLCDWARVAQIEQRLGLPQHTYGVVDRVAPLAPVARDAKLWHSRKVASRLIELVSEILGDQAPEAVQAWIHLRELVVQETATAPELLGGVEVLLGNLGGDVDDIRNETETLLDIAEIEIGHSQASRPFGLLRP